jgi:hypothetical protein
VTFTATVTPAAATGTVTFKDDGVSRVIKIGCEHDSPGIWRLDRRSRCPDEVRARVRLRGWPL